MGFDFYEAQANMEPLEVRLFFFQVFQAAACTWTSKTAITGREVQTIEVWVTGATMQADQRWPALVQ